jgi:hypothetical protein
VVKTEDKRKSYFSKAWPCRVGEEIPPLPKIGGWQTPDHVL